MNGTRPNIVIFLTDDQGYGDLGCYGNPCLRTPHLDRLAGEGVRLDQHYSASPICAPARAALLTGRCNHRTGALSVESNRGLDRIALRERTLGDVFSAAGYATGLIGKWHNGLHDLRYHPNQRGFAEFAGFLNGGMDYWDWLLERNGSPFASDGTYLTDFLAAEAAAFIERHRTAPFLLLVAFNAPHLPLQAPAEELGHYRETPGLNRAVATLYAMVERMDHGVGRILACLERHGLARDTAVLFTSDNGPMHSGRGEECQARWNGPFRGGKYDVLEGGIRVPAMLRWPAGLPAGQTCAEMTHFCDWLPTLAAMSGITRQAAALPLDGVSLLPTLRGEAGRLPEKRFWQFNRYRPCGSSNAAMRDGPWKLCLPPLPETMHKDPADNLAYQENLRRPHTLMPVKPPFPASRPAPAGAGTPELYRLDRDPEERHDLAASEPDRVRRMRRELDEWFAAVEQERMQLEQYRTYG